MTDSTEEFETLEKPEYVEGDPRSLTLLDVNARYMTRDQFLRLVENIKRDGHLTSLPLVWNDEDSGRRIVLSGNHRTKASIEAGLETIPWLEIKQPLERQRQIALQLSHNAITGQDDPAVLKQLWEEMEGIEWREYAGLDDKTLDLLEKVDLSSLGEAGLDYSTVQIMFLPHEVGRAQEAFEYARSVIKADVRWTAADEEWDRLIDALDSARASHNVVNTAAAFTVLLDVFEKHIGDLREGWYDETDSTIKHEEWVPWEAVLGSRRIPPESAAIIAQAADRMKAAGDLTDEAPWRILELLAADYLAGQ